VPGATGTDQEAGATTVVVVVGKAVAAGAVGRAVVVAVHEVTPTATPSRAIRTTAIRVRTELPHVDTTM
jgi:hypothetical protein